MNDIEKLFKKADVLNYPETMKSVSGEVERISFFSWREWLVFI